MKEMQIIPFMSMFVLLSVAVVSDIRLQKIPNWITYPAMATGVVYHTVMKGTQGFLFGMEGLLIGVALLIIPYLMGGMGAGDAKLLGAIGAFLGPKETFLAFLFSGIVGGIYAVVVIAARGRPNETAKRCAEIVRTLILTQTLMSVSIPKTGEKTRLSYGLAIVLGTIISIISSKNLL